MVIIGERDGSIKIWNIKTHKCINTLIDHDDTIFSVFATNDYIISASGDHTIKIWNIMTGALLNTMRGHTCYVYLIVCLTSVHDCKL